MPKLKGGSDARMVRVDIHIWDYQDRWLRVIAAEEHRPLASLIRQAIDTTFELEPPKDN